MRVTSLGFQTDLALLAHGGSEVHDRGGYLVVRTPRNPTFWWGNFLLLPGVPPPDQATGWLETFTREFPDAAHRAIGFDGKAGRVDDLAGFAAAGMDVEGSTVMTADRVHEPPRPNRDAVYRALAGDDDWHQQAELSVACRDDSFDEEGYRNFATKRAATMRDLTEAGHGGWFGAFVDGRLLSAMGLFATETGLARFQSVETHPDARGRGLAGTLVHHASAHGFAEYGARTLVMVADPDYAAIRLYRSVGFADTETQLQADRRPLSPDRG